MKKIIISMIFTLLLSLYISLPINSLAAPIMPMAIVEDPVEPASEETVWYTRIYNGKVQRRLWSITYGEWLTDWEDVP